MMLLSKELTIGNIFPEVTLATKRLAGLSADLRKYFLLVFLLLLAMSWHIPASADLTGREQAKRIHDRLTGVPPTQEMLTAMETAIANGATPQQGAVAAARLAIDGDANAVPALVATPYFYNVTVKNWASPWTNQYDDAFVALNDYTALVIGLIRDEVNFQQLLNGTVMYVGADSLGLPAYSMINNTHYEQLERSGANLGDTAVLQSREQVNVTDLPAAAIAGIFSTRAAGEAFYIDGTNRAMLRFTLRNHLCNDLEQLKDTERPADRIRQDVSRSPGGDSRLFLTGCVGCHSGMDPLAQAFAYYQYDYSGDAQNPVNGRIVYTPGVVQPKYHINEGNFKEGYITPDDSWTNYWRQGPNVEKLGWLTSLSSGQIYTHGNGANSMGNELAHSQAFAYCQVKKAFRTVCLQEPAESDRAEIDRITTSFQSGYNMKNVFAELAASCAINSNL